MKILFVTHDFTRTGAPISLLRLLEGLSKLPNLNFDVAYIHERGDIDIRKAFERLINRPMSDIRVLRKRFNNPFRTNPKYDLILFNTIVSGEVIEQWKDVGVPIITWIHEMKHTIEDYGVALAEKISINSKEVWCVNQSIVDFFQGMEAHTRIFQEISQPCKLAHKKEKIPVNHLLKVACAGLASWRKGIYDVPHVLQKGHSHLDNITWFGVEATNSIMRQVMYQLQLLSLDTKFHVGGVVTNLPSYLVSSDVFLLLSHEDPFPLVCLEAASVGVPTICWDLGNGIADFVQDDAGWKVPYGDFNALSELLAELRKNPAEITLRGDVASNRLHAHFTPEVRADEFNRITQEIIQENVG